VAGLGWRRTVGVVAVGVLAVAGCGRGEDSASGAGGGDSCTVAYSQGSLSGEWRAENSREMQESVEEAGCTFIQASANDDVAKQLQDVNDLLAKKPDLLVVAPVQFEPLAPVPGLADKAGVPLIVVDRALPGKPGEGQWKAFITIDFVESGVKVGESIVKGLTEKNGAPKGNLVHITGTTGASPVIDEQKGIDQVLAEYPDIKIVGSCDGKYAGEPGRKCMEDLLQRFDKGEIDGMIADNDESGLGAMQAIDAAGRTELYPWIWGKDAQRTGLEAMLDGKMYYTISTPPQFGQITMETWDKIKDGSLKETTLLLPKIEYSADETEKIQRRIDELTDLGINCC
jgi:ABC-type sugar transport system substrate-binding protein